MLERDVRLKPDLRSADFRRISVDGVRGLLLVFDQATKRETTFPIERPTMALVDPYAPCHCGSGQKYKWCCQSVEAYVERSQRLLDNGQYELAINPLLEGLAKVPDNVSLLLRKALVQLHLNQTESASETLRLLLQKHPGHLGGSILMTRLALDTEGRSGGRGPVSAGALGPRTFRSFESLHRWPRSSARRWPARNIPPPRSSIWTSRPGSPARKQSGSPRPFIICEPILLSRSGRRTPIASGQRPSKLRQRFANHSSGPSAGPRKGSGHRLPRPSSCWGRVRAPA